MEGQPDVLPDVIAGDFIPRNRALVLPELILARKKKIINLAEAGFQNELTFEPIDLNKQCHRLFQLFRDRFEQWSGWAESDWNTSEPGYPYRTMRMLEPASQEDWGALREVSDANLNPRYYQIEPYGDDKMPYYADRWGSVGFECTDEVMALFRQLDYLPVVHKNS